MYVLFFSKDWSSLEGEWPNIDFLNYLLGAVQHSKKIMKKKIFTYDSYNLAIYKESTVELFCTIQ